MSPNCRCARCLGHCPQRSERCWKGECGAPGCREDAVLRGLGRGHSSAACSLPTHPPCRCAFPFPIPAIRWAVSSSLSPSYRGGDGGDRAHRQRALPPKPLFFLSHPVVSVLCNPQDSLLHSWSYSLPCVNLFLVDFSAALVALDSSTHPEGYSPILPLSLHLPTCDFHFTSSMGERLRIDLKG